MYFTFCQIILGYFEFLGDKNAIIIFIKFPFTEQAGLEIPCVPEDAVLWEGSI